ncbi:MAG TPA: SRPBCC domain-containing protein [Pyrinomonadaceae bacterium]
MTNLVATTSTRNSKFIKSSAEALYRAFTDPTALAAWQAPGNMTAKVHGFDLRVGGGYEMSLFYPQSEQEAHGKTSQHEDRFSAQFLELTPARRIVESISFHSADPGFSGKMFMIVMLEERDGGTEVTILFENIPRGIWPADNEAGTQASLEKLASYLE